MAAGAGSGPAWPGATRRGRLAAARRTSCSRAAPWRSRAAMIACVTFRSSAACAARTALARFMDRIPTRIPTAATAAAAALTIEPNADTAATVTLTRLSHQKGWGIRSNGVKILHDPRRRAPAECAQLEFQAFAGRRPRPCAPTRLYFATFASGRGGSKNRPRRHRGRQSRNDSDEEVAVCISVRRIPLSFSSAYPWKEPFAWVLANLRAAASAPT